MPIQILASSPEPCLIESESGEIHSKVWFRYGPLTATDCARLIELQLITNSHDQGNVDDPSLGSYSWFDILLVPDLNATEPIKRGDDETLQWRSHTNRLGSEETTNSTHFGYIFDRSDPLLQEIKPGMVIAIRACAQFGGWKNDATEGWLNANVAERDIFGPKWSLVPDNVHPDAYKKEKEGLYTIPAPHTCRVESTDDRIRSRIWFTTPPIDADRLPQIQDLQLITQARNQGEPSDPSAGNWTWFDIVVLESTDATEPKVKGGLSLVWRSHDIDYSEKDSGKGGAVFGRDHPLINLLEVGDVIAVRLCARFAGWHADATDGSLIIRISHEGRSGNVPELSVDYTSIAKEKNALAAAIDQSLHSSTLEGAPPPYSPLAQRIKSDEIRADQAFAGENGEKGRPLRLLSLDGGGIRGISAVVILREIMKEIAGDKNAKPCEYFDMMAGTSTGGLLAIMLGRLRMSIDDCEKAYKKLSPKIFGPNGQWNTKRDGPEVGCRFSGINFEQEIKEMLKSTPGCNNPDEPMRDPRPDACKVFVVAARANNLTNIGPAEIRTYKDDRAEKDDNDPAVECSIWEAARATAAAPTYFPQMTVGPNKKHVFIDGGFGYDNPVLLLAGEAKQQYKWARPIGCIVTIGTGLKTDRTVPEDIPKGIRIPGTKWYLGASLHSKVYKLEVGLAVAKFSLSAQMNHHQAKGLWPPSIYYRFNAFETKKDPGMTEEEIIAIGIDMDDYSKIPELETITDKFMDRPDQHARAAEAAKTLELMKKQ